MEKVEVKVNMDEFDQWLSSSDSPFLPPCGSVPALGHRHTPSECAPELATFSKVDSATYSGKIKISF